MKFIKIMLICFLLVSAGSTAHGISAFDIRWGTDLNSNMRSNTLKQWAESMEGRAGGGGRVGAGDNYYVDSGVTTPGDGSSWSDARETFDEVVALCTANNDDNIHIAAGHAETWSTAAMGATLDIAGINIIGYGNGSDSPTFTYTHADATIDITVAAISMHNLRFVSGVSAVVSSVTLAAGADYLSISGCEWVNPAAATYEFYDMITLATGSDYVSIADNKFVSLVSTTGCNQAINVDAGIVNRLSIVGNEFQGAFTVAAVHSNKVNTNILVAYNAVHQATSGQFALEFTAASTGMCIKNSIYTDAEATAIDPGSLMCIENYVTTAANVSGMITPVYDDGTTQLNATTVTAIAAGVDALDGVGVIGLCETNASATTVVSAALGGFGNDAFLEGWSLICIFDTGGAVGTAPSGEVRDITDYVSTGGTFTTAAWTAALTAGDYVHLTPTHLVPKDYGKVIFCDDGGSDGEGTSWQTAKVTLAKAEAIAAVGDTIRVGENHNENLTTGGDTINIAGVTVIGEGTGDSAPLFDMDADSDELTLDAAGITLRNLRFRPGATALTSGIRVEDAGIGCTIEDCTFEDGEVAATDEWTDCISVDTLSADLTIRNCDFYNTGAPGTFINLDEATIANTTIEGCTFFGACTEAPIWGAAAIPTNVLVKDNMLKNTSTGQLCIEFQGAATGSCVNNMMAGDTYGAILDPGSMRCFGNMQTVGINAAAEEVPLVAGKSYTRRMLFGDVGAAQNIFSITGSPIIIEHMWGLAKVAIGGAATLNLEIDADDTFDYDLSTAVDIQAIDQGGSIVFSAALGEGVLTPQALGSSGAGIQLSWFGEEGMLESDSGGDTGNIEWYMVFKPVGSGCEVIPQTGNDE